MYCNALCTLFYNMPVSKGKMKMETLTYVTVQAKIHLRSLHLLVFSEVSFSVTKIDLTLVSVSFVKQHNMQLSIGSYIANPLNH